MSLWDTVCFVQADKGQHFSCTPVDPLHTNEWVSLNLQLAEHPASS